MYKLIKKSSKNKCSGVLELIGYETKIEGFKVVVYYQKLIDSLIKDKLIPAFNKIVHRVLIFLDEDGSNDDAEFLLDELARLHALYLNKYERFLSKTEQKEYMKNLRVLTNELKPYTRKHVYANSNNMGMRR